MIRLPIALHQSTANPGQPQFDTLIGVCNPFILPHAVEVHCFDLTGAEVPKSPVTMTLAPGEGMAMTFIEGNIFENVPEDWNGHIEIVFPDGRELPVASCLGGGGIGPQNWNVWSPNVEVMGSQYPRFGTGKRFVFPYLIPFFEDPVQHAGNNVYDVGLKLTNLGGAVANLQLVYTVDRTYPNAGAKVVAALSIAPGQTISERMIELMPSLATMNPRDDGTFEGSEGWLDIQPQPDMTGEIQPVNLMGVVLITNVGYDQMAFTNNPFIVA